MTRWLVAPFLCLCAATAWAQQDLDVDGGTVTLNGISSYGNVTVETGATLVLNGTLNLDGGLTVKSGALVTQLQGTSQLVINAPNGTVNVQTGGKIDVSGLGLRGGNNGSAFGGNGEATDSVGNVVQGSSSYSGGSHGGGGVGLNYVAPVTDSVMSPSFRGGGGGDADCGAAGGNGGGALKITANALNVDGQVRADGAPGHPGCNYWGGAGAGGSIWVSAGTVSGAGILSAAGAPFQGFGGYAGGGGRIAITTASTNSFTGTYSAAGASWGGNSGAGTVYVVDGSQNYTLMNGTLDLNAAADGGVVANSVTLGTNGVLRLDGAANIKNPISIPSGATVQLNSSAALQSATLASPMNGTLVVGAAGLTLPALTVNGTLQVNANTSSGDLTVAGTMVVDAQLNASNLTLQTGALATHDPQSGMTVNATGTITVSTGARIDVSAKGLPSGQSYDPNTLLVVGGSGYRTGASHGGQGQPYNSVAPIYDNQDAPTLLGGGGGNTNDCGGYAGGTGGGRVRLTASTLDVDGSVLANGAGGPCNAGGGAGGSIWLSASTFQGAGIIDALGGNSSTSAGGGGRIEVDYASSTFSGSVSAAGGNGGGAGRGSAVLKNTTSNDDIVQSGFYRLAAGASVHSVTLSAGGVLYVDGNATITLPLSIPAQATVDLTSSSALTNVALPSQIAGTLVLDAPLTVPALGVTSTGKLQVNAATTMSGDLTVSGALVDNAALSLPNLTLQTGASATHDPEAGVTLNATNQVTVASGAQIDVSGKGLPSGQSYDPNSLNVVSGSGYRTGGSYGGMGQPYNSVAPTYGSESSPNLLGGGGGYTNDCGGYSGGAGGGRIRITAQTLQLDGLLQSNGAGGPCNAGGGAGGSVWVSVTTFAGAGQINAVGGNSSTSAGGGGRVEVDYTGTTFSGQASVAGGNNNGAQAGTLLIQNRSSNDIVVEAGQYHLAGGTTVHSVTLDPGAVLHIDGNATITVPLVIPAGAAVDLAASNALANVTLPSQIDGTLIVDAPLTLPALTFSSTGKLQINAATTCSGDLVTSGTLIDDAQLTVPNLTLQTGAYATHDSQAGLNIAATGTVTVAAGAKIDVSGKGLSSGQTYDPTSLNVVGGSGYRTGASYGGVGQPYNSVAPVYGNQDAPNLLGGGGGYTNDCGGFSGGSGGGRVRITAATLQLDGLIQANGSGGPCNAGGGAGGSIWLSVGTFAGAGQFNALGGDSSTSAGGGGRVEIDYTRSTFTGQGSAVGGNSGTQPGRAGSLVLKNTSTNDDLVESGEYHLAASASVNSVTLSTGGILDVDGSATITQPLVIPKTTTVELTSPSSLAAVVLPSQVDGTLVVSSGLNLPALTINGALKVTANASGSNITLAGSMTLDATLSVTNFTFTPTGYATHDPQSGLNLQASGNITIPGGARVDVSGMGLYSGQSYDPNTLNIVGGSGYRTGGSYGGAGAPYNYVAPTYGNEDQPNLLGGGGGYTNDCGGYSGGSGGGRVRMIAGGTLQLDGTVVAFGNGGPCNAGGGAGGSIWLSAGTLAGAGLVSANGGSSSTSGGGGGRIELDATTNTFAGTVSAIGNSGGGLGSVAVKSTASTSSNTVVEAGQYHVEAGANISSLTLANGGIVYIDGASTIAQPVVVPSGTSLYINAPATLGGLTVGGGTVAIYAATTLTGDLNVAANNTLVLDDTLTTTNATLNLGSLITHDPGRGLALDATGTVLIPIGASIDVSGKGLGARQSYDPVSLQIVSNVGTSAGGTHGGLGGPGSQGGAVAPIYGDEAQPVLLGGGGGNGDQGSVGGAGGGRIRLTAGILQVDGAILANGASANGAGNFWAGGGAGGSIWIATGTLKGGGVIRAAGGNSGGGGGGGGGGRVWIGYGQSAFTGNPSALGGNPGGGLGSLALFDQSSPANLTVEAGEYHLHAGDTLASATLSNGGVIDVDGNAAIQLPVAIPSGTTLRINDPTAAQNLLLPSEVDGTLVASVPLAWPGPHVVTGMLWAKAAFSADALTFRSGSSFVLDARADISGNLQLATGSTLSHSPAVSQQDLHVGQTMTVSSGALVDLNGKGLPGGRGAFGCNGSAVDPNTKLVVAGAGAYGGASFGGLGGGSSPNPIYGAATDVQYLGSGGGCGDNGSTGGPGGGLTRIDARWLQVDGVVRANGGSATAPSSGNWAGGGSGGGISIVTGTLAGQGVISVNGGSSQGAGGGAGRLEIQAGTNSFSGVAQSQGGPGAQPGAGSTPSIGGISQGAPFITSIPNTNAALNVTWQYNASGQPSASGTAPITWSLDYGPSTATINPSTGAISWTPTAVGGAPFTLRATNNLGYDTQSFTVIVGQPPKITSQAFNFGQVGSAYHYGGTDQVQVTGTAPIAFSVTNPPTGNPSLSIDNSGKVTWTPTQAGQYTFCIVATNSSGQDQQCVTVQVSAAGGVAPVITTSCNPYATAGAPYDYDPTTGDQAQASGSAPIVWQLLQAPTGMTVAADGTVAWTAPATPGTAQFVLSAANAAGSNSQTCQVTVTSAPLIASQPSLSAQVGVAYSYGADGGTPVAYGTSPITWSLDNAPTGASVSASTGAISWTPVNLGAFDFQLRATNAAGTAVQPFTVNVLSVPQIVSSPNLFGVMGVPYQYNDAGIVLVAGSAPFTFSAPNPPPGNPPLSIDDTGAVTWTPLQQGAFNICLDAQNAIGQDQQCFTVQVGVPGEVPPRITSQCNTLATVGVPYLYGADGGTAQATGTQPFVWSLTAAPPGMTVDQTGAIAWTPEVPGGATYALQAANSAGADTQTCVVTVETANLQGPPVIHRDANLVAAVGLPYRYSFDGKVHADGDSPITFSGTGPAAFAVDPNTGYVGWTPTAPGPVQLTINASNSAGQDSYTFTVTVVAQPGLPPFPVIAGGPWNGPAPLDVSADGSASFSAAGILGYSWDFGDGSVTVYGKTATHTYSASGGYQLRLTVYDVYGQKGTASKPIQASSGGLVPPTAKIVLTSVVGNGSLTASFGCDCQVGSAPIIGYQWLATDGFFSDQAADTHTFQPGGYTLQLIVVDRNGLSAVDRQQITVADATGNQPPFAVAHASPSSGTAPLTVKFTADYGDDDGFITASSWTFSSDNSTVQADHTTRTYSQGVREHAVFSATDNGGLSTSAFVDVEVAGAGGKLPPEILSVPRTSVFAGEPYTYNKDNTPVVRGTGPFAFKLTTAPTGATIDADGGAISWTPDPSMSGDAGFALEVDGAGGSATQSWQVQVTSLGVPAPKKSCGCGALGDLDAVGAAALVALAAARRRRSGRASLGS